MYTEKPFMAYTKLSLARNRQKSQMRENLKICLAVRGRAIILMYAQGRRFI
jgi:hypothetical protein